MISICQRLLNTSDVSRALLKSSFNSHNSPVADSPLYRQGLRLGEKVTRLDGERQWRDSNPHLRADKGLGGGRPVCAHVGLWLKSWGQVRPPKKQTNKLLRNTRQARPVRCAVLTGVWSLGPWHGCSEGREPFLNPVYRERRSLKPPSLSVAVWLSHAHSTDSICPPSRRPLSLETWLLLLISQGAVPRKEASLSDSLPVRKGHAAGTTESLFVLVLN